MNTASESVKPATTLHGVWFPLDDRLFRKRIERMADLIGHIDYTKDCIPDAEMRAKIVEAVALVHTVAIYYDDKHAWGLYSKDDIECEEVNSCIAF